MNILDIKNCTICYQNGAPAVSDVSLSVSEGEIVSIVGESGSGKTTLIRAVLGLLPPGGKITGGEILFDGIDLAKADELQMQDIRGKEIAMIFQDVGAALDPIQKIRNQYEEAIEVHEKLPRHRYVEKAVEMLKKMHLTDPNRVMNSYPFELSGGMKQRVGIAMAMTFNPELLLADEPTSALDVTTQAQIVRQMMELRDKSGTGIIIVTHNLGVAAYMADQLIVMQNGKVVDQGTRDQVMNHPTNAYTKKLLAAVPEMGGERFV